MTTTTPTMHDEMRTIIAEVEARGEVFTEKAGLELCRDAERFPKMHAHTWAADDDELLLEARLARVRSVVMRLRITTVEGDTVRFMTHVRGVAGYQQAEKVAMNGALAASKLRQLSAELRAARGRFNAFRRMMDPALVDEIDAHLAAAETLAVTAAEATEQPASGVA